MCGISGFFEVNSVSSPEKIKHMSSFLHHRGPDQYGEYVSADQRLYLAHQRLSILDLSDAGKQPMLSSCGGYAIVFNGEIYNFAELKKEISELKHIDWKSTSDTEVLLECINIWGVEDTLPKLNGMFAFSFYDSRKNKLYLARDRFGEKPLYIYSSRESFAFASELKPLEVYTNNLTLNQHAVNSQLRYSYIPAPYSIYHEVFKLLPGHYMQIDLSNIGEITASSAKPYWQISDIVEIGLKQRKKYSNVTEAIKETEHILTQSVKQRMVADVPLGSFLSGGIDSTCITALMQASSSEKIKTFSIGFNDKNYNEAHHAKIVADILGTEHHELYLNANDMLDFVPKLADIYDEPFSDSSQLPTLMVSKFARQHVTVALTGDSGDEVFCGYNRYNVGVNLFNKLHDVPYCLRNASSYVMQTLPPSFYNLVFDILSKLSTKLKKYKRIGDNIHKLARIINFKDQTDLYNKLILTWPEIAVTGEVIDIATDITEAFSFEGIDLAERMMWQDTIGYMQNDILTKVDRASMSASLETRVPFLDNNVFQHAWSLPSSMKIHNGQTKYPLRKIISKYIPDDVMQRPKAGFAVPIDSWLRKELRPWAESLLTNESLSKSGVLNVDMIRKIWHDHLSNRANMQTPLWNVLMFQLWLNRK